jgi:hypothetical protein
LKATIFAAIVAWFFLPFSYLFFAPFLTSFVFNFFWFQAPPPGKSPDRDGASDPDVDKKGLDSEMDMAARGNSEKKDAERPRRGLEINLEDDKMVQRMPADEVAPKKLTLQLDLEKPSLGDEKSPSERRPQPALQQQKPKNEIKHEKSAMPAVTPPMPIPVGSWLGSFPPFG